MTDRLAVLQDSNGVYIPWMMGGMGVNLSSPEAAIEVGRQGGIGAVSSTGWPNICSSELQQGDLSGDIRWAMDSFPVPDVADKWISKFYIEGGKPVDQKYKLPPLPTYNQNGKTLVLKDDLSEFTVLCNYALARLAKRNNPNTVIANLLYTIQHTTGQSLLGLMLGGIDGIVMGAGFPAEVPRMMDALAIGETTCAPVTYKEVKNKGYEIEFDPLSVMGQYMEELVRGPFGVVLSKETFARKLSFVDWISFEDPTVAGGHVPSARSKEKDENGEPKWSIDDPNRRKNDPIDLEHWLEVREQYELRMPYYFGGGWALRCPEALSWGAAGVQFASIIALAEESGADSRLKQGAVELIYNWDPEKDKPLVVCDEELSPAGYPFHKLMDPNSIANPEVLEARIKNCPIGLLKVLYETENGIGTRCRADDVDKYVASGGKVEDTKGAGCLCTGLIATAGYPLLTAAGTLDDYVMTIGKDIGVVRDLLHKHSPKGKPRPYTIKHAMDKMKKVA